MCKRLGYLTFGEWVSADRAGVERAERVGTECGVGWGFGPR